MKKPIEVVAEGLGHPEGPDVLPDGRVVFANTYASEVGVWEPGKGKSTYAYTGGGPNACMLGTDGYVYVTQCPTVGAWVAPETRPPSIQRAAPDGTVEVVVDRGRRHEAERAQRPDLRARRPALLHGFRRLGSRREAGPRATSASIEADGSCHLLEELEPVYPNGIVAEPDGSIVWVESYTRPRRPTPPGRREGASSTSSRRVTFRTASRSTPTATSGSRRSAPAAST